MSGRNRGRGRPRPDFTIERDEQIYDYLRARGPQGRWTLADEFGVNVNIIYLSLNRLRREGLAEKVRNGKYHLWRAIAPA